MAFTNAVLPATLRNFNTGTLTAAFQPVNAGIIQGFEESISILRMVNNSDVDVIISFDGTNDHEFLPSGETFQLPLQTNSQPSSIGSQLRKGTIIYVRGPVAGAGTGLIYLSSYYIAQK